MDKRAYLSPALSLLILLFCLSKTAVAQFFPTEGAALHFKHVLFQWQPVANASHYQIEIYQQDSLVLKQNCSGNSFLSTQELNWKNAYQWKVIAYKKKKKLFASPTHNFSLRYSPKIDSLRYKHEVETNLIPDSSFYILLDHPSLILNLKGEPIWFYPDDKLARSFSLQLLSNGHFLCLKPRGTGSGNENQWIEEVDRMGKSIWISPKSLGVGSDTSEFYHHDVQKLSNGNYLLIGNEFVHRTFPNQNTLVHIRYGTVLEVNPDGKLVWYWKSSEYLKDEDVFAEGPKDNPIHLNAIFYVEEKDELYISLRYLSQIIKLKKSTKEVLAIYGQKLPSGEAKLCNDCFAGQHSPKVYGNYMYVYDNGSGKEGDRISEAVVVYLPDGKAEFRFPLNTSRKNDSWSESKGDIDRLNERMILVNMGSVPRTLIIDTAQHEIVWHCRHYSRPAMRGEWTGLEDNYRTDFTRSLYPDCFEVFVSQKKKSYFLSWKPAHKREKPFDAEVLLEDGSKINVPNWGGDSGFASFEVKSRPVKIRFYEGRDLLQEVIPQY